MTGAIGIRPRPAEAGDQASTVAAVCFGADSFRHLFDGVEDPKVKLSIGPPEEFVVCNSQCRIYPADESLRTCTSELPIQFKFLEHCAGGTGCTANQFTTAHLPGTDHLQVIDKEDRHLRAEYQLVDLAFVGFNPLKPVIAGGAKPVRFVAEQHVHTVVFRGDVVVEEAELLARPKSQDLLQVASERTRAGRMPIVVPLPGECRHQIQGDDRLACSGPALYQYNRLLFIVIPTS